MASFPRILAATPEGRSLPPGQPYRAEVFIKNIKTGIIKSISPCAGNKPQHYYQIYNTDVSGWRTFYQPRSYRKLRIDTVALK
jgi:hypothetical protein